MGSSWCPPCREEAPDLAAASRTLKPRGAVVIGLNTRDITPTPARAFVRTFKLPYPSVYDPDGRLLLGFRDTLPANAIPSTLIIDARGKVAARVVGAATRRTIEALALEVADQR